jgi:hypothetical protein
MILGCFGFAFFELKPVTIIRQISPKKGIFFSFYFHCYPLSIWDIPIPSAKHAAKVYNAKKIKIAVACLYSFDINTEGVLVRLILL